MPMKTISRLFLPVAMTLVVACTGSGSTSGGSGVATAQLAPADQAYTVEGVIESIPSDLSISPMSIRHQSIDEFVDREGAAITMHSMSMPFNVADTVSTAGLAHGDAIRFTFEVRWESDPILLVTALEQLPADHAVDFHRTSRAAEDGAKAGEDASADDGPAEVEAEASETAGAR